MSSCCARVYISLRCTWDTSLTIRTQQHGLGWYDAMMVYDGMVVWWYDGLLRVGDGLIAYVTFDSTLFPFQVAFKSRGGWVRLGQREILSLTRKLFAGPSWVKKQRAECPTTPCSTSRRRQEPPASKFYWKLQQACCPGSSPARLGQNSQGTVKLRIYLAWSCQDGCGQTHSQTASPLPVLSWVQTTYSMGYGIRG